MKYFIISGSPVYGFRYVGPFDSPKLAENYRLINADKISKNWWLGELLTPIEPAKGDSQ